MDDIFRMMNNTNSSAGQEYLYRMLRQPDADMESLKKLDRLATAIDKNASKRLELQKIFVWIGRAKHISISDYCDVVVGLDKKSNALHYASLLFLVAAIVFTCVINPVIGIWLCIAAVAFSIITATASYGATPMSAVIYNATPIDAMNCPSILSLIHI